MLVLLLQVNNAGVSIPEKQLTSHGLELTMATNHYGHFLLTNLLLGAFHAAYWMVGCTVLGFRPISC